MGNMLEKTSTLYTTSGQTIGDDLNYEFDYEYDENYAHRVKRIGDIYYQYDSNGNVVLERDGEISEEEVTSTFEIQEEGNDVYSSEYGWALEYGGDNSGEGKNVYERRYEWDDKNMLIKSSDDAYTVDYSYGFDGQRTVKNSSNGETLYFNSMWSWTHNESLQRGARESKNIYLGSTRIATRINGAGNEGTVTTAEEQTYYYHADHVGSAQFVTNHLGEEYERIEYTPYGETWVEKRATDANSLPYKFTGKELDEETGLYYYGARYLDPKTSRWLSTDPALGEYIPQAPVNDEARQANGNLPGMGGIYNQVNFHLYHYAGNNPVKYVDPDGREIIQHDDKKGFGRVLAELKDCFGLTIKAGYGVSADVNLKGVEASVGLNGGGIEETFDKYGYTSLDTVETSVELSILDSFSVGISARKETPSTDNFDIDSIMQNAWSGETEVEPILELPINNTNLSVDDKGDVKIGLGAQVLVGGEVWVDVTEVYDLGSYLSSSIKTFAKDLFNFD